MQHMTVGLMSCTMQVCIDGARLGTQSSLKDAAACMCSIAYYSEWELCGWAQSSVMLPVPESGSWDQVPLQPSSCGCHRSSSLCGLSALTEYLAPHMLLLQLLQSGRLWSLLAALLPLQAVAAPESASGHCWLHAECGMPVSMAAITAALCLVFCLMSETVSACPCIGFILTPQPNKVVTTPP